MIQSILLPLSDNVVPESAVDCALWLANSYNCRIHALAIVDIKSYEMPVLGTPDGFMPSVVAPPIEESQALLSEVTAQVKGQMGSFAERCRERKVPCSTDMRIGVPGEIIAQASVAHDLVVMARAAHGRTAPLQNLDSLLPPVIRSSVRPIWVPSAAFNDVKGVLIAYDGSVHASRVLSTAMTLASRSQIECHLVNIAASEETGLKVLEPADAYLRNHGIEALKRVVKGSHAADTICDLMEHSGLDVLLMGAYGHSPIREMIFGSTTEKVLSHCDSSVVLQY